MRGRGRAIVYGCVGMLAALSPAPAAAGMVEIRPEGHPDAYDPTSPALVYVAAQGETNTVIIAPLAASWKVTDSTGVLVAGPGCTTQTPHEVVCPYSDSFEIAEIVVHLGDGNDSLSLDRADYNSGVVFAGEGNDTVIGGGGFVEEISGGAGNDDLRGGREIDVIDGGPGADTMGGGSSGLWHGGAFMRHNDAVTYEARTASIRADFDAVADDGEAGEGDRILNDVEIVRGGSGNDVLMGDGRSNFLSGRGGSDVLNGFGRNDHLRGGNGNDQMRGGRGRDQLFGAGDGDILTGGLGRDRLAGGGGPDLLKAQDDSSDVVRGGPDRDTAWVNSFDSVRGVERLVGGFL